MKSKEQHVVYEYDQETYKKHLGQIATLEQEEKNLLSTLAGLDRKLIDGWAQPTDVATTRQKLEAVRAELYQLKHMNIKVIEVTKEASKISIGHVYNAHATFADGSSKNYIFKLVPAFPEIDKPGQIDELTIHCPIGQAILGKEIGEVCTFKVNGQVNQIKVIEEVQLASDIDQEME